MKPAIFASLLAMRIGLGMSAAPPAEQPATGALASLGNAVRQLALDPESCYRVRDLQLRRGDARLYFNDGWLIFARPVQGRRLGAVFAVTEPGQDAEITLRPPDRSERLSLAAATGSPNLSEHFRIAALVFTDNAGEDLMEQIQASVATPNPEMGLLLTSRHDSLLRNLAGSFQVRLVLDLVARSPRDGIFFAALAGNTLGNFDLLHDPMMDEPLVVGAVANELSGPGFKVWTSFEGRASRREGRTGRPDVRLQRFVIDARLAPDLALEATTRIQGRALETLKGALVFEIAPAVEVVSASWNGTPVELFRRESLRAGLMRGTQNDSFLIAAPGELAPGTEFELEFRHKGRVVLPAGPKVFFVGSRMNWYPCRGDDFALFDLTFQVPKDLQIVATGELREERVEGEWRISRRITSSPVRLAGFNLGDYEKTAARSGPYLVEVYANRSADNTLRRPPQVIMVPTPQPLSRNTGLRRTDIMLVPAVPPDATARLKQLAEEVVSGLDWMRTQFGPPPLSTITVSPIPGFFGQGFPGLIYLSTVSYLNAADRPDSTRRGPSLTFYDEILHAHELAHQWWGNLVTSRSYRDDWIQEALANYSALLFLERRKGPRALHSVLEDYRDSLRAKSADGKTAESAGPIAWGVRLHGTKQPDPWRAIVYDKGSWILHMLRRRMGDARFANMLGAIRQRFEYKSLSAEDLRQTAAEFSPPGLPDPSLEAFFDTWVRSTGIPALQMSAKVQGKAPKLKLTVTVRQSEVEEGFSVDVPVEIRVPGAAQPIVKWVRTSSDPVEFTLPLNRAPSKIELAPGDAVLASLK